MTDTSEMSPKLIATIDVALFTLRNGELCVALAPRDRTPNKGMLALIGGYVHTNEDEDTLATAKRVLMQKAGVSVPYLEQLYTFSGMKRDDRGWSISVAYFAVVPESWLDIPDLFVLVPVGELPALPFDHNEIVEVAVKRLRDKATYSSLPAYLLQELFTMTELQKVYEQVTGSTFDNSNFRRKIREQGIVEPVLGQRLSNARPAQLYRLAAGKLTEFARQISQISAP